MFQSACVCHIFRIMSAFLRTPQFHHFELIFVSNEKRDSKQDRFTQPSKRIILKYGNEQILDFARLENEKYSLEFKHPFSPLQAFAVAISSISRLFR